MAIEKKIAIIFKYNNNYILKYIKSCYCRLCQYPYKYLMLVLAVSRIRKNIQQGLHIIRNKVFSF